MPNPTLTWTSTNERAVAIAGTTSTVAELLVAIKAAIDNDSVKWATSDYNAGNGTLEIKRKVSTSPTGEQATLRILFFGGQIPNSAGFCSPNPTLANTYLYVCASVDANTTGPSASYASAAPYSTKLIKANSVCLGTVLTAASSPRVSLLECDDALAVVLHDTTSSASAIAGYLIEDASTGGLHWAVITTSSGVSNQTTDSTMNGQGTAFHLPMMYTNSATHANYWNSTTLTCRMTGRLNGFVTATANPIAGSNGAPSILMPIVLGDAVQTSGATISFFGTLRQIRLGPQAQNLSTLRNQAGVQQAIHFGPPVNATGYGLWFDQVP